MKENHNNNIVKKNEKVDKKKCGMNCKACQKQKQNVFSNTKRMLFFVKKNTKLLILQ